MKTTSFFDWVGKSFLTLLILGSLSLILSGLYYGGWWAGFGLVLFMTSLLVTVCYVNGPTSIEILPEKKAGIGWLAGLLTIRRRS